MRTLPDGGKYTRPRRGYRTPSHYRERLQRRGLTRRDVKMESLPVLRKKQGYEETDNAHIDYPSAY